MRLVLSPGLMPEFEDADALTECFAWILADTDLVAAFGGPEHVSGLQEAPWPRLRLSVGPGGDAGDLRWDRVEEVLVEVFDHPAGTLGQAECRRLLLRASRRLARMPEDRVCEPGQTVVTNVRATGAPNPQTMTNGQHRWVLTLAVSLHPGS